MKSRRLGKVESGFVSIFSVLIIMFILTLVTVGFSLVTRRSERRTIDDQLNKQAFYAAESGVNDAVRIIRASPGAPGLNKTSCTGPLNSQALNYDIDAARGVGYTCLLVNDHSPLAEFSSVPVFGVSEPVVVPSFTAATPTDLFTFEWDAEANPGVAPLPGTALSGGSPALSDASSTGWGGDLGIVQVDMTPTEGADPYNRANLANGGYTFYLYPTSSAAGTTTAILADGTTPPGINAVPGAAGRGGTAVVQCVGVAPALRCKATVRLAAPITTFGLRLASLYNSTQVKFSAIDDAGKALDLRGGLAVIDVTGKANDVYRRIQVTVPLSPNIGLKDPFSVQTGSTLCKRILVNDTSAIAQPSTGSCSLAP